MGSGSLEAPGTNAALPRKAGLVELGLDLSQCISPPGGPERDMVLSEYTFVFLPGESQGQGRLVGCGLWGRTESDTTEAT